MNKTLLLAPEIFSSEGGVQRILRIYLKALCDLSDPGGQVRLLALNDSALDSRDLRKYSNSRLAEWEVCHGQKLQFVRSAHRLAKGSGLVVCGHIGQLPIAWMLKKLYGKKLNYTLIAHGIEVWRKFTFLEKIALRNAHRIWCVSEYTRRELLRNILLPIDRTVVQPNALDPFLTVVPDTSTRGQMDFDILTVSRLSQSDSYKGIDQLIEAMPLIRHEIPAARLRIVGRGDDLARLQAMVIRLQLSPAVTFLGYVNDEEMKRELAACRVFALPSQKEGFGLVYLEAMAHGKPCVAVRDGGAPEVITPETGTLATFGHIPSLATACVEALRRPWDPAVIRARADEFSYSRFRQRLAYLLPFTA